MESHASATATASKKRKLSHDRYHQEDDTNKGNEEEEMEEFFALVRSIREARDRLKINVCSFEKTKQTENSTKMKRKLDQEDKQQLVVEAWKPTFQREDFLIDDPPQLMIKNVPLVSLQSSSQKEETTEQKADQDIKDQGLDLTLSL